MSKKLNWDNRGLSEKIVYITCIVIALIVMVLAILSALHILESNVISKVTTVLLNLELIVISIGIWKTNKVFTIVGVCIALILIIITLI